MQEYADIKINTNGDWELNNMVKDKEAIIQLVNNRLNVNRYTNKFDYDFGIDINNYQLDEDSLNLLIGDITNIVLTTAGVISCEIINESIKYNSLTGTLTIPFQFEITESATPISSTFQVSI